jgi:DNA transformation protein
MSSSPEFATHCVELLAHLGPARSRRMFGGHGFYVDDLFIGIAAGERLYLKADEKTRARFEAAGCAPFEYDTKDGSRVIFGLWTAPEDALESPMLMQPWARLAMEAALRARTAKPVKSKAASKKAPAKTKPGAAPRAQLSPPRTPARKTSAAKRKP